MPSLRLSNFDEYVTGGSQMDVLEVRAGEAYAVPFTIRDNQTPPQPINLTNWTFTVSLDSYTGTFTYNANGTLATITQITEQGTAQSIAGLQVTDVVPNSGTGVLTIPAGATNAPINLVTADGENTLLNVITITASYPSSVAGFNSVRKLLIGLIVRIS